jgi:succinate dehydrogenase / fumarate reductase iron-sulfur subunit/fumarate reductase iron-sulfur subunit
MKVNIKRYLNGRVWFDNFETEYKEDETVLELLDRIKNIDRSVTYRSFCRSSICGTCTVKVNDRTVLACKTKVKDFLEHDEIIIEPADRMKVIKDLVTDHSLIEESIKRTKAWFEPGESQIQLPNEHKKIEKQSDCILCMACYAECEALDYDKNFAGPFAFTKLFRFFFDSRDALTQERIDIAKENGLNSCINCQKCVMVCPKNIAGAFDIQILQKSDINSYEQQFSSENSMFF